MSYSREPRKEMVILGDAAGVICSISTSPSSSFPKNPSLQPDSGNSPAFPDAMTHLSSIREGNSASSAENRVWSTFTDLFDEKPRPYEITLIGNSGMIVQC